VKNRQITYIKEVLNINLRVKIEMQGDVGAVQTLTKLDYKGIIQTHFE